MTRYISQEKVVTRHAVSRVLGSTAQNARHDKRDTRNTQHKHKRGAHSLASNSSANVLL